MNDFQGVDDFLSAFFATHAGRDCGDPYQKFIPDSNVFRNFYHECERQHKPCFMSVQPRRKHNVVFALEKLFFDFDCEGNVDKAFQEAKEFSAKIKKYYGGESLLVFSGHKGYHLYVFCEQTLQFNPSLYKPAYEQLQKKLLRGLDYETLDPQPLSDVKRLARVPYSRHEETGHRCTPVTMNGDPLLVLPSAIDGYRQHGLSVELVERTLEQIEKRRKRRRPRHKKRQIQFSDVRPCVNSALRQNLEGHHKMRHVIAVEFLHLGWRVEDVVQLFATQPDFDPEESRYQVSHARRQGYRTYTCEKIRGLGFCLEDECPIFKHKTVEG